MRLSAIGMGLIVAAVMAGTMPATEALAAEPYCLNPSHVTPAKVPPDLVDAVAKTFAIDSALVANGAFVRCVGTKLMACSVGANLVCGKADKRRTLPGAAAWCRDNPGSNVVPMSATGHATIYDWSCKGARPVAGKTVVNVDRQGYIAENWKDVR